MAHEVGIFYHTATLFAMFLTSSKTGQDEFLTRYKGVVVEEDMRRYKSSRDSFDKVVCAEIDPDVSNGPVLSLGHNREELFRGIMG